MALTPNLATFRIIYPELASASDAAVELWLDDAISNLVEGSWGPCYGRAALSWAAHNVALGLRSTAETSEGENGGIEQTPTGAVISASAEGLSVTFAQGDRSNPAMLWWNQTSYGQAYLAAQAQCLGRGGLSW